MLSCSRLMRMLALVAVLVAGCATTRAPTSGPELRISRFEQQGQKIDERENRCINEALRSSDGQVAGIAAIPGTFVNQPIQNLAAERDRTVLECRKNAEREREKLTMSERADYQNGAQEERDDGSLMMILTTSRPH